MMKEQKALLEKAIEMRQRGERYQSIIAHLKHNCKNEEEVRNIITELDELEANEELSRKKEPKFSLLNMIGGAVLICAGQFLVYVFWDLGYIAVLPFTIILMGCYMMFNRKWKSRFL